MNNVWTTIACRVPATARPARTPLLQLFNGYAKSLPTSCRGLKLERSPASFDQRWYSSRTFSTNTSVAARKAREKPRQPPAPPQFERVPRSEPDVTFEPPPVEPAPKSRSDSRLEPAPTVASHTEGLSESGEALTWRDYDPSGGMPLPNGELNQSEINAVFNSEEVHVDTGNYILSVMHWRRLSGALIDVGLDFPRNSGVDRHMALMGLQYVRTIMPDIDESAMGQQWAEEESERLQEQIQARAVKLGLYKADVKEEKEEPDEELQGTEYGRQKTGESVLQQTREANEAAWEQVQAQQALAKQKDANTSAHKYRGPLELAGGIQPMIERVEGDRSIITTMPSGITIQPPESKAWLQPVERRPWVKYYEDQATIIKDNNIPQLSSLSRLGPPLLIVLLVLAGSYYLSMNYTPPPTSARLWPETSPGVATLYALTGVLVCSFLLGRLPPLWRFYSKYMVVVPAFPYAVSVIGATFRHDTVIHLASNLASLWLFGLLLHEDVGRGTFLAVYLASGVCGAYSSLLYNVLRKQWMAYILGSSGSVLGVAAAAVALRPNGTIRVFGYDIPIAAWIFLALFTGAEALAVVRNFVTNIDHAGHLGGIATGVGCGLWLRVSGKRNGAAETSFLERNASMLKQVTVEATENR